MKFIICIVVLVQACLALPVWSEQDTLLALLLIREEETRSERIEEVFLFGQRTSTTYRSLSHLPEANATRRELLEQYRDYTILQFGQEIAQFTVDEIAQEPFECFEEVIGRGHSDLPPYLQEIDAWDFSLPASRKEHGNRVHSQLKVYFAINTTSPLVATQHYTIPFQIPLDPRIGTQLLLLVEDHIPHTLYKLHALQSIEIAKYHAYDFEGDGIVEHLVEFSVKYQNLDKYPGAAVLVYHLLEGDIIPIFQSFDTTSFPQSTVVEVLDINADNVPEILLFSRGHETVGLHVYAVIDGKFERILAFLGWGC